MPRSTMRPPRICHQLWLLPYIALHPVLIGCVFLFFGPFNKIGRSPRQYCMIQDIPIVLTLGTYLEIHLLRHSTNSVNYLSHNSLLQIALSRDIPNPKISLRRPCIYSKRTMGKVGSGLQTPSFLRQPLAKVRNLVLSSLPACVRGFRLWNV